MKPSERDLILMVSYLIHNWSSVFFLLPYLVAQTIKLKSKKMPKIFGRMQYTCISMSQIDRIFLTKKQREYNML